MQPKPAPATAANETPPIICKGTPTQPACKYFRDGSCYHPSNMTVDYVRGGTIPFAAPFWRRGIGEKCGPLANEYERLTPF